MRRTLPIFAAMAVGFSAQAARATVPVPTLPAPHEFVGRVDNPWFPLLPGTIYEYRGAKDGKNARDVLTVTRQHRTIEGIRATVIRDRLYLAGHLAERTTDWYAQDRRGNVWYLGERTATLDPHGRTISTEGSWRAGVDGARAGIYMPAHPRPPEAGRQEFYPGHAEDQFKVLSLSASVATPAASSHHALLTQETTRLEPGTVDHKLYVRGVGTVLEHSVRGGSERLALFSFQPAPRK
jgi:hypothetical protein